MQLVCFFLLLLQNHGPFQHTADRTGGFGDVTGIARSVSGLEQGKNVYHRNIFCAVSVAHVFVVASFKLTFLACVFYYAHVFLAWVCMFD